ncbi:AGAP008852-PA, partial [Anopheles gambiae str. PEST]
IVIRALGRELFPFYSQCVALNRSEHSTTTQSSRVCVCVCGLSLFFRSSPSCTSISEPVRACVCVYVCF